MKFYLALGMALVVTMVITATVSDVLEILKMLTFPILFIFFRMILATEND